MNKFFEGLNSATRSIMLRLSSRAADYRGTFATPHGERVLVDLMKFCGAGQDIHVSGDSDETFFNLGKYRVAQRIASFLEMDEMKILRIIQNSTQDSEDSNAA